MLLEFCAIISHLIEIPSVKFIQHYVVYKGGGGE